MDAYRNFQVTLISAHKLLIVKKSLHMKVYAKVSISGNSDSEWTTPVDQEGNTNPQWNCTIRCSIPEKAILQGRDNLVIKLYCKISLESDRYVGEVNLSLKKLFDDGFSGEIRDYDVLLANYYNLKYGSLKLSYKFETSTTNINVQGKRAISTTGQGSHGQRRIDIDATLQAASLLADGIQIYDGISKGRNMHDLYFNQFFFNFVLKELLEIFVQRWNFFKLCFNEMMKRNDDSLFVEWRIVDRTILS